MPRSKKDFTQANTGRAYNQMAEAIAEPEELEEQNTQDTHEVQNPRTPYTAEKVQEMREAGTTQGRKGCKAVRINMAFTPDIYEYIRTMARLRGESVTAFTNFVFRQSMEYNSELYERAKQFTKDFKYN